MIRNVYSNFFTMLSISFFIMYIVMYFNVDKFDFAYVNTTKLYMTLLMVTPMALVMLLFMKHMYNNRKKNLSIIIGCIMVFYNFPAVFAKSDCHIRSVVHESHDTTSFFSNLDF